MKFVYKAIIQSEVFMKPIVVCFGTAEVSGDSLAPMVGSILKDEYNVKTFVYGDLNHEINGNCIDDTVRFLKNTHEKNLIIAVDASVGKAADVGKIIIKKGVRPKAAFDKNSKAIGDVGILGVVAENTDDPLCSLLSADAEFVRKMAEKIAKLVNETIEYCL
ncbi:MAG: spore protease YyaC, partial [Christensenellales bacterium]